MVRCAVCNVNEMQIDPYYGSLPCTECMERQSHFLKPSSQVEFTSQNIKQGRKAYWNDYHPAHRKGKASREFLEKYGRKKMKQQGFTDKEIDTSQYVWNDDKYYHR